ncbi:MAG: DUF5678 domain-containing protein [Chloroflexota bacterium]
MAKIKDGKTVFESDVEWFHQHRQELVPQYQDQYVAILNGAVVDHDPGFEKLAERIYAKYGYRDFVMQKVKANAKPHRIVSPRLVRP